MTHIINATQTEVAAATCGTDPDVRILRRVSSLNDFPLSARGEGPIRRVAVLDTETTGTDPLTDEIIDVAVVVLEVDAVGEIVGIASAGQSLRDPGVPIPAAITRLTGISDSDVRGKTIDLDRLERRLASADVLLAPTPSSMPHSLKAWCPGLLALPGLARPTILIGLKQDSMAASLGIY